MDFLRFRMEHSPEVDTVQNLLAESMMDYMLADLRAKRSSGVVVLMEYIHVKLAEHNSGAVVLMVDCMHVKLAVRSSGAVVLMVSYRHAMQTVHSFAVVVPGCMKVKMAGRSSAIAVNNPVVQQSTQGWIHHRIRSLTSKFVMKSYYS